MNDQSHLNALRLNRSNEAIRLANAVSVNERCLRKVWLDQLDREIADEEQRLGLTNLDSLSDEDLLRELSQ